MILIYPQVHHQSFDIFHEWFQYFVGVDHKLIAGFRLFLNVALPRSFAPSHRRWSGIIRFILLLLRRLCSLFILRFQVPQVYLFLLRCYNLHAKQWAYIFEFLGWQVIIRNESTTRGWEERCFIAIGGFQIECVDSFKWTFIIVALNAMTAALTVVTQMKPERWHFRLLP